MRVLRLDAIERSAHQLQIRYSVDRMRFSTSYWYGDVDLDELEARFGKPYLDWVCFHAAIFEAIKGVSLKPDRFDLGPYAGYATEPLIRLWSTIANKVWAQWRYEHDLPDYEGPIFAGATAPAMATLPGPQAAPPGDVAYLAFCGGGKDSLVSAKLLERAAVPFASFVYSHSVYGSATTQHHLIDGLLGHCQTARVHRQWVYDDFLDAPIPQVAPELGIKGLLAAETPSSIFAALPLALAHGYRYLVLGHEHSADVGNLVWSATGEDVNHQWGKSTQAERLIDDYVKAHLVSNVRYFSVLKPVHDVVIFNLLRTDLDAVAQTHSCNVQKPWCKRCPKCAYVWLNYMAWLPAERVDGMFGENLFDLPENALSFRQMLGLAQHTPFECIGQVDEARLAFELCRRKGLTGAAMDVYTHEVPSIGVDDILARYAHVDRSYALPDDLGASVYEQMEAAAQAAKAYVRQLSP